MVVPQPQGTDIRKLLLLISTFPLLIYDFVLVRVPLLQLVFIPELLLSSPINSFVIRSNIDDQSLKLESTPLSITEQLR